MWASYSPDDWRQRCIGPIIGQQCRQSASGGSIFGSYLAAMAYNEDSPHCPAAPGKILWRKILVGRTAEHLRNPSLLMRARAQATVRVWTKRPELQAHSRIGIRSGCGLPVATGAVS